MMHAVTTYYAVTTNMRHYTDTLQYTNYPGTTNPKTVQQVQQASYKYSWWYGCNDEGNNRHQHAH
eukprot:6187786-Pleurochrysis_carterae.AAC.2